MSEKNWKSVLGEVLIGIIILVGIVFLIVISPYFQEQGHSRTSITENGEYYVVHHEWNYDGSKWTYDTEIPKSSYEYFSNKDRTNYYAEYVTNPADDEWMNRLGKQFKDIASEEGWGSFKAVSFVLAFVQNMPYTNDKVTTGYDEYPRYPIETIIDGGGDCEDSAILFASIIRKMNYDSALLKLEADKHMAGGIAVSQGLISNWDQPYSLTYYTHQGSNYAYCETTGVGWELGEKPGEITGISAQVIDV
ncbi:MAG: hypothetical protein KGY45_04025 [Hadesarchaea archaeon]|nr:hypothetical protein [Hadesarchaea archaeon]